MGKESNLSKGLFSFKKWHYVAFVQSDLQPTLICRWCVYEVGLFCTDSSIAWPIPLTRWYRPCYHCLMSLLDVTAWCCVDLREFSRNYDQMAIQRWHGRSSWNSSDKQVGLGWYKGNALSPNEAHQVIAPWTPQESLHVPLFFSMLNPQIHSNPSFPWFLQLSSWTCTATTIPMMVMMLFQENPRLKCGNSNESGFSSLATPHPKIPKRLQNDADSISSWKMAQACCWNTRPELRWTNLLWVRPVWWNSRGAQLETWRFTSYGQTWWTFLLWETIKLLCDLEISDIKHWKINRRALDLWRM